MANDYSSDPPVATAGQLLAISDKISDISKNYACLLTFIYNKSKEYGAY